MSWIKQAILVAMTAVEVRVRMLARYGSDLIDLIVHLMQEAFKPNGQLADPSAPWARVEAPWRR
jgi:hypothetical protein